MAIGPLLGIGASILGGLISQGIQSSAAPPKNELDQDAFLKLLVAQLRNQDPLNPMHNQDFIAQTAQFRSVEELANIRQAIGRLGTGRDGTELATGAALIGRAVKANGTPFQYPGSGATALSFALPAPAASLQVQIQDGQGQTVRTLVAGQQAAGPGTLAFDGRDEAGRPLAPGTYTYRVLAFDASGAPLAGATTLSGSVRGVSVEGGRVYLTLDGGRVPLGSVIEVGPAA
jgi:flagellar basal-body rod modification protein FlgD